LATVVQRKVAPPIIVINEIHCALKHLLEVAATLAKTQRASREASFIVFFCGPGMRYNVADRIQLLQRFPEPTKVEIAFNRMEMQRTIQEVIAKWQVLQMRHVVPSSRPSPLDAVQEIVQATQDLREANGNLSVKNVAPLFRLSLRELAQLLGRTPQALSKTPDADSLQDALGYFEKIARLRSVLADDDAFRKWLRIGNPTLGGLTPLMILRERKWQELADLVDDVLMGSPG